MTSYLVLIWVDRIHFVTALGLERLPVGARSDSSTDKCMYISLAVSTTGT